VYRAQDLGRLIGRVVESIRRGCKWWKERPSLLVKTKLSLVKRAAEE